MRTEPYKPTRCVGNCDRYCGAAGDVAEAAVVVAVAIVAATLLCITLTLTGGL